MLFAFVATATPALAHGCGTSDHWSGGPHHYEGHYDSGNSHFHRWYEVNMGSGSFVSTFCGCLDPDDPCFYRL